MSSDHKFQTQIRALHLLIGAGGELEHRIYPFAAFKWEKKKRKEKVFSVIPTSFFKYLHNKSFTYWNLHIDLENDIFLKPFHMCKTHVS